MKKIFIFLAPLLFMICGVTGCLFLNSGNGGPDNGSSSAVLIQMELIYQYKDTSLSCVALPLCTIFGPHPWNHAAGQNGTYGDSDDCPHCAAYCAPASIAMIAKAYGKVGNLIQQDYIYDNGKSTPPEFQSTPAEIQTHGVGMYDGTNGQRTEVQDGLLYALEGMPYDQHDINSLNWMKLRDDCILKNRPVLWLDHGGWPANQSEDWPTLESRQDQGHAKIIAGYDDRGTAAVSADDLCLIYDPWPEYNHKSMLPSNAFKGQQDTFDPYWLPQSLVLSDTADIFLVPVDSIQ